MRQPRDQELLALPGKADAAIERHIAGWHIDAYLRVTLHTGIVEQRFHDRLADLLLAPLWQHRDMPDVAVGQHPPAADGLALQAESQRVAGAFVQPVPLQFPGDALLADEYRLADRLEQRFAIAPSDQADGKRIAHR